MKKTATKKTVRKPDDWIIFPHKLDGPTANEVVCKEPAIYTLFVPELFVRS